MTARRTDVFLQLPITMNETTKAIEPLTNDPTLAAELDTLNSLCKQIKNVSTDGVPPPPMPVNPQRSAQIERMRTTGNNSFRKGNYQEAIQMYSHGITMALTRPPWEPATLLRDELSQLYGNRAQAHMSINNWPEALADASVSVELKKPQNQKAHWRKGKCLKEMGRLEEAKGALEHGIDCGADPELTSLLKEVKEALEKRQK